MRLSTAISVLSASGVLAGNYGMPVVDTPPAENANVWASKPTHTALYAAVESSVMIHKSGVSSVMVHDATSTPTIHHATSAAMIHETTAAMVHETISSAAPGYTASASPPMAHEGPITHTVSHTNTIFSIGIYS